MQPQALPSDLREPDEHSSVREELETALAAHRNFGQINPRPPGLHNRAIQAFKELLRRSLTWYTRPNQLFQAAMIRAVSHTYTALQSQARRIQQMHIQNEQLRQELAALRAVFEQSGLNVPSKASNETPAMRQAATPALTKESEQILDYWETAAERDPMRETVTQWTHESDEEYQRNWSMLGEYIASKIMANSPPNPVALEIGPGMGRISIPMSRHCKSILALDISPKMASRARDAMARITNFAVDVITDEDLSFLPAARFDLAYSIACFQHANKKSFYRYLQGIRRALKPGGVLFFSIINLCSPEGWKHFHAIVNNDYPEFFHTPDEIACYVTHAGYTSHQLEYEGETLWVICRR